jgi:hypothetical protein
VESGILDGIESGKISSHDLVGVLMGALGIKAYLFDAVAGKENDSFTEIREAVHKSLGAPGDWGYGTLLGKALQNLYQHKI